MRALRSLLAGASPKDEDLAVRVRAIKELRLRLQQKGQEFEDCLDANLTQVQRAKYILFQAEFNRALGERLNRARALLRKRGRF
jgi:aspartate ammonia-lyase